MRPDSLRRAERVGRLRSAFPETDALLILNAKNIRYLTGFTGGDGALMAGRDWLTLLVDGRYLTQARAEAGQAKIVEFRKRTDGIVETIRRRGAGSIGFESSALSVEEYLKLKGALPEGSLRPLPDAFRLLRAVKDEAEMDRIRQAARIAGKALADIRGMIRPGVRSSWNTGCASAARSGPRLRRSLRRGPNRPFPMPRRGRGRSRTGIS